MKLTTLINFILLINISFIKDIKGEQINEDTLLELTIPQIQTLMKNNELTSYQLVKFYLSRIGLYEDKINATLSVNHNSLSVAKKLDQERQDGIIRGPLHGIPIAIKDNIHTKNMPTTAGTLAFENLFPPYDATLVKNLKDAGAIIIAKTVLTEMANWMVLGMPNNYSAVGGYSFNPYDFRKDPRHGRDDGRGVLPTGSSSSGSGTASNFWVANIGTETVNSVIGPASATMLAAIKPTIGRISRWGIIPVSYDQDSAGPMTRTVEDAAILLGVLEGKKSDPNDKMTSRCSKPVNNDYKQFLDKSGLKGKRIGIPREWFVDKFKLPGKKEASGGIPDDQKELLKEAISILERQGATVLTSTEIPSAISQDWSNNSLVRGSCTIGPSFKGFDEQCSVVLKYSFKRDFNTWLETLGEFAPVSSLTQFREWNIKNTHKGTLKYAQHTLDISDEMDLNSKKDYLRYNADRQRDIILSGEQGVDKVLEEYELDALLFIGSRGSRFLAKAGYPSVIVPFGFVDNISGNLNNYPSNFNRKPSPIGITFSGTECSEPSLISIAYAFEKASMKRVPPILESYER